MPHYLHGFRTLDALHCDLTKIGKSHSATIIRMFHLLPYKQEHVILAITVCLCLATPLTHTILGFPMEKLTVLGIIFICSHRTLFALFDNIHIHRLEFYIFQALHAFPRRRLAVYR